ncbi:MAG: outer membrane beta-barrel protein [Flavobacteriales bacterium]|nr:outer membrane beta-barrel protein [Flavobacteriales bacterium]
MRARLATVFLLGVALSTNMHAVGQRPGGGPANGKVSGKVLDAASRKPAEFATVTLYAQEQDSVITGTMVRPNGDFVLDQLRLGRYRVPVSFLGYKVLERPVAITRERPEMDLGNILLETDADLLQQVDVVKDRSTNVLQVDRRVFHVDKDLSTRGGTGVDVMKNVPGLSVDVEGNVQMRGASPQILVDGRPSSLSLEQIPAEEIERVEVITNPSVIFDANTTGGIINVILKKSTKPGYSGQVQGGAGTNDRYQAGLNFNLKDGRWGLNASYNFNTGNNVTDGSTARTDLSQGITTGFFDQATASEAGRLMHGGRAGVDWQVSNRSTLSLSQGFRIHDMKGDDLQQYTSRDAEGSTLSQGSQYNISKSHTQSLTSQLMFRHKAPKEGKEWSTDLTYNRWDRESRSTFAMLSSLADGAPDPSTPRVQDNLGGSYYDQITWQLDFVDPVSPRTKWEYGLKSNFRLDRTWLDVYVTTPLFGEDIQDSALTNDYKITDMTNAAYVNWSRKLTERWSLQAGLRFEQTMFITQILNKDQEFDYRYPDGADNLLKALFPAIYLVRRWEDSQREVQINFSRKISRPRFWQVMPVIMFSDSRNVRIGNPALAPELSNLAEVNHLLPFFNGKATWLTSVFGRYTEGAITSYSTPLASDTSILLSTFVNGRYSVSSGWENVIKLEPVIGLQLTLSGTVQYTDVALAAADGGDRNAGTNWNAKVLVNYRLPKDWGVQVNAEYESARIQAQGRSIPQYGMDLSMSKDFTKKFGAVLSVNDVFFTRKWGNTVETDYLSQESFRRREMRFVRFTLTWKFGEQNSSLFRRRQGQREQNGGEMDM